MPKRNLFSALFALCLALSLTLTACAPKSDTRPDSGRTPAQTQTVPEIPSDDSRAGAQIPSVDDSQASAEAPEQSDEETLEGVSQITDAHSGQVYTIPDYSGEAYVALNDNIPDFDPDNLPPRSFEEYSELDSLGRCGVAYANVGLDLMPTEKRESIGQVKPSGWQTVQYDIVDGKYLYNRCHLIGYQLTAENANKQNLITGTRYLNVQGMLPFENLAADYIKETGNHVLYRVTPVFDGDNLVASGVQMEAISVEDKGEGVLFNVYCYNVQPGIVIDYATGESIRADELPDADALTESADDAHAVTYILNTTTRKFHYPDCSSAVNMKASAREEYAGTRDELIAAGYEPCGRRKRNRRRRDSVRCEHQNREIPLSRLFERAKHERKRAGGIRGDARGFNRGGL